MKHFLSDGGQLSEQIPGFRYRQSQLEMAELVAKAISEQQHLMVEAGTGTGKTFAYLLPAMGALQASKNQGRQLKQVVIATGTKNLQDQLFYDDLPRLNKLFKLRLALLKGRANYLCPERLQKSINLISTDMQDSRLDAIIKVRDWSVKSKDGDLTDFFDANHDQRIAPLVTSSVDNCLAGLCPHFDDCPLYKARNKARSADMVVVNHHLLLADLALDEDYRLLPDAELVIVDEAHDVVKLARQFFGMKLSSRQFYDLVRDVKNEMIILGNDDPNLVSFAEAILPTVDNLSTAFRQSGFDLARLMNGSDLMSAVELTDMTLAKFAIQLKSAASRSLALEHCYRRLLALLDLFALLTVPVDSAKVDEANGTDEYLHWIESRGEGFVINRSPVSIVETMAPIFNKENTSWCFVSATLTVSEKFDHFRAQFGLTEALEGMFESPFDFPKQVKGYLPRGLPRPGTEQHTQALLAHVLPIIRANKGRTFFLFTSHRALDQTALLLANELDITFLKQGDLPKKRLLKKFRELESCVLLATQSFWQGVDVSGADLRCLIIDKLPFGNPDDPLLQVILAALKSTGINGFYAHSLPEAAISLKQGFGRLIRNELDQGLFILGDERLVTKRYGPAMTKSLPEFTWYHSGVEAIRYLKQLNRKNAKSQK